MITQFQDNTLHVSMTENEYTTFLKGIIALEEDVGDPFLSSFIEITKNKDENDITHFVIYDTYIDRVFFLLTYSIQKNNGATKEQKTTEE